MVAIASCGLVSMSAVAPSLTDTLLFRQQAYIAGDWCDADDGLFVEVKDPATEDLIGRVPDMGAAETRRAIEAAEAAWPAWRALTGKERGSKLRRWFELSILPPIQTQPPSEA
eukprot:7125822-Prymnesium_polylepis.1